MPTLIKHALSRAKGFSGSRSGKTSFAGVPFRNDESGNFATLTAIGLSVLLMGAGMAIDYSGSSNDYQRLQSTVDAAVLSAAAEMDATDQELIDLIEASVQTNFDPSRASDDDNLTVVVTLDNDNIDVRAEFAYSTFLLGMFGRDTIDLVVDTGAPRRNIPSLNIALVVDTTDSMDGANMADLQAAVGEMIDIFDESPADISMSLVPYSQYVNVGPNAVNRPWVDASFTYLQLPDTTEQKDIYEGGREPLCWETGNDKETSKFVDGVETPVLVPETECDEGEPGVLIGTEEVTTKGAELEYEFNGCMGSRDPSLMFRPDASAVNPIPAAMSQHRFRPDGGVWTDRPDDYEFRTSCGQVLTPLTRNLGTIRNRVASLVAEGETYLPAGLIWGWRTLDERAPYRQAGQAGRGNNQNVMIFMTDGLNSSFKNGAYHRSPGDNEDRDTVLQKARTGLATSLEMCEDIRNAGIEIYTVAYNLPEAALAGETEEVLMQCASSPDIAFRPDNRTDLIENFRDITAKVAKVRLEY